MLKTAGICLILLAGAGIGFSKSLEYTEREKKLAAFLQAVIYLKGEIRCGSASLAEAFAGIAGRVSGEFREFFACAARELENGGNTGRPLGTVICRCGEACLGEIPFSAEERELIGSLGDRLGYLDREMQLRQLELLEEEVRRQLEGLRRELPQKKKLCQSLGVLGAMLLVILLW